MKESFYFSHDANARKDEKILCLLAERGYVGYGIYWALIEMMFDNQDTAISRSLLKGIAFDLRIEIDLLKKIITTCHDVGLFQADKEKIWSESLRRRKEESQNRRKKFSEAGLKGNESKWGKNDHHAKRSERLTAAREINSHTKGQWNEMLYFFNHSCSKCGSTDFIVKDHIKPIYQGGSDGIENLQPLCRSCNSSKGAESTDYRKQHANASQMPRIWFETPPNASQESKRKEKKVYIPPTIEEVNKFFTDNGYSEQSAKKAFEYYQEGNWHDSEGKQVKAWKQKMRGVWFKDENKIHPLRKVETEFGKVPFNLKKIGA